MKGIVNFITVNKNKLLIGLSLIFLSFLIIYFIFSYNFYIKIDGNNYVKLEYNTDYKESGYNAKFFGEDLTNFVIVKNNIDKSKLGKYKVQYIVKKNGITIKKERIVEVVDTTKPVIKLKGDVVKYLCTSEKYEEEGYEAYDNYDGDITDKVELKTSGNFLVYTVKDKSNNIAEIKREIVKGDIVKPKIILNGASKFYIRKGNSYQEPGYKSIDNCNGDITSKVNVENNIDVNTIGSYKVVYSVEDSNGYKELVERKIEVVNSNINVENLNKEGIIYLTFDDGPSASITPKLLDILKEKKVKVTFFVVHHDNLEYLIKRAHDEGHKIALHSYTHNYAQIYSSDEAFYSDLKKISDEVEKITGEKSFITRFPGGSSNTVSRRYNKGIVTRVANELLKQGYHYFDWNVSSGDAGGARTSKDVYNNVVGGLSKNKQNVVLLHDFTNNFKTLNAIPDIIDYAKNNGYVFKVIDKTTPMIRHRIAN